MRHLHLCALASMVASASGAGSCWRFDGCTECTGAGCAWSGSHRKCFDTCGTRAGDEGTGCSHSPESCCIGAPDRAIGEKWTCDDGCSTCTCRTDGTISAAGCTHDPGVRSTLTHAQTTHTHGTSPALSLAAAPKGRGRPHLPLTLPQKARTPEKKQQGCELCRLLSSRRALALLRSPLSALARADSHSDDAYPPPPIPTMTPPPTPPPLCRALPKLPSSTL